MVATLVDPDIGRRIFSRRVLNRTRRSRVPFDRFLPPAGTTDISVDELSEQSLKTVTELAINDGHVRKRTFRAWAAVSVETARRRDREVVHTPTAENPYHHEIRLPPATAVDRDEQKRHAKELADASRWRDCP